MIGYLTKFDTKAGYNTYVATDYDKPNVSLIATTGEVIFTNFTEPYPAEPIIFDDNAVKAICVEHWGSDGELTYGQASAVTSLEAGQNQESAFKDNTTIVSFDELQYFTGLRTIMYQGFSGCTNLESVTLPETMTHLAPQAFNGCTSLTDVTIPEGLQDISASVFGDCTSLTTITLPSTLTSLGLTAFDNCTSLTTLTVKAETPPTLGFDALIDCSSLIAIYVPGASVDAYKAASGWSNYASRIQAIPLL